MNKFLAKEMARAFDLAANQALELRNAGGLVGLLANPEVVNRAFAVEFGLKALILHNGHDGQGNHGHDLKRLFDMLRPVQQQAILGASGLSALMFDKALKVAGTTFIDWRRVFERGGPLLNHDPLLQSMWSALQGLLEEVA